MSNFASNLIITIIKAKKTKGDEMDVPAPDSDQEGTTKSRGIPTPKNLKQRANKHIRFNLHNQVCCFSSDDLSQASSSPINSPRNRTKSLHSILKPYGKSAFSKEKH